MKKLAILLGSIFVLFSCEEVIEIDVPSGEPKLVIEATFEVFFNQTPVSSNTVVKLRTSTDYFEEQIPVITNATVVLEDVTNNTTINFLDADADGNYEPLTTFIPEDNVVYELIVTYNNEVYKARASKIKSPSFISVVQGDATLFSGEETEIIVTFLDDINEDNYYLFNFDKNIYNTLEDRFFNGSEYVFSTFYQEDEVELPEDVVITMSGISKDYYTYFRVLSSQSGQGGGGPFQTVPASLLGNIVNTTNIKNFPLGYFHISETDTYNLSLK